MKKAKIASLIVATTVMQNTVVSAIPNDEANRKIDLDKFKGIEENAKTSKVSAVINGIPIKKMLIDMNYSKGVTISPKYIVIHDTDNRSFGAGAIANRNYFANHPNAQASAHFTVDDRNIVQVLEETWRGWHIGDRYPGVKPNRPEANNSNTIGIEITVNPDSNFDTAMKNAIELTKYLMFKHNIPASNVITHNDATGKICPRMMLEDRPTLWPTFKSAVGSSASNPSGPSDSNPESSGIFGAIKNVEAIVNTSVRESVYSGMGVSTGVTGNVYPNEKVKVNYFLNDWANITFNTASGGTKTGFINASKLNVSGLNRVNKQASIRNSGDVTVYKDLEGAVQDSLTPNRGVTLNYTFKEWSHISYVATNGSIKHGFVNSSLVKISDNDGDRGDGIINAINKNGTVVNTNSTKVYLNADENSDGIGFLYKNDNMRVNFSKGAWYNVTFTTADGSKKNGYIKSQFVSLESSLDDNYKPVGKGKVINVTSALRIRKGPGTTYDAIGWLYNDDNVEILGREGQWFKIKNNDTIGYCHEDYIKEVRQDDTEIVPENPLTGKGEVINITSNLRIRSSASTSSSVLGYLNNGDSFDILGKEGQWYQISHNGTQGYIYGDYVKVIEEGGNQNSGNDSSNNGGNENTTAQGKGQVINITSNLRIRSKASTDSEIIGYLNNGDTFDILGKEGQWYQISRNGTNGYIHGDYVKVIEEGGNQNPGSDSGNNGVNENNSVQSNGQVINVTSNLRIRSSASTSSSVLGYLNNGDSFNILGKEGQWYHISYNGIQGYIHGDYVKEIQGNAEDSGNGNSGNNGSSNENNSVAGKTGQVINVSTGLRMRSGAGTNYEVVGWLYEGDNFEILGKEDSWYKINKNGVNAYIHSDYVKVLENGDGNQNNSGSGSNSGGETSKASKGNVINAPNGLRIREGAGTNYSVVGWLYDNDEVKIAEKSGQWYKIEAKGVTGYVHSDYIKTSTDEGSNNENTENISKKGKIVNVSTALRVRKEPNTSSEVLGFVYSGSIVDIKGKTGEWYKISYDGQEAYVHSDYVKEVSGDEVTDNNNPSVVIKKKGKVVNVESSLRVREKASTDSLVVGYLSPNETFDILDKVGDWYKINFDTYSTKKQGYVHKDYVKEFDEVESDNATGREIVEYAKKFLGVEYVWGGTTPNGFDCSGFTQYVYKHFGIETGRTTWDQIKTGRRVTVSAAQEGDLIFFGDYDDPMNPVHVGMYMGNGDVIHASYGAKKIKISKLEYFGMNVIQANRYIK
ncbi:MAG: hypothetical protein DBY38_10795 [Clostridium cadaveris]|uniref:SH3 domain-containing protein n=1 Tax=Clostridium cadaveris TaxID=1529 RepID=A0A316M7C3_9CLOT|nr:MAG: hypothetical protein DBY38_10795 [Clostridium cadaveris]